MGVQYIPLLRLQRELYDGPPGRERFLRYIATMRGDTHDDMALPLSALNPMAKDHVPALLDDYLAAQADDIAATAVAQVAARLDLPDRPLRVALVLADDARGGWTNRYTTEFAHRYKDSANHKRGWLTGLLWSSEPADLRVVAREAAAAVCRFARIQVRGYPVTLEECMQQSGLVATQAGSDAPMYDDDELHYTREVLAPFAQSTRPADVIPCLFGDRAAAELGYPPLGLSPRAGLALAAHEAQM